MSDDQFIIDLIVKMRDEGVESGLKHITNEINRVSEGTKNTGIDKMSRDLLKLADTSGKAETATRGWAQSLASVHAAQFTAELKSADSAAQAFNKTMLEQSRLKNLPANTVDNTKVGSSFGSIVNEDDKAIQQASRSYSNLSTQIDGAIEARKRESATFADGVRARMQQSVADDKVAASAEKVRNAAEKSTQSLSTTRYALYDVAGTATIAGGALLGMATAAVGVAAAWESDFANVARTSGATGVALKELRGDFVDLAQTMPTAFGDLAEIGTLGAQLGIAQQDLASFTQTVVKFSTATGITAEASAMAFGRLGNILGVAAKDYEKLGSSIAFAGLNAVSTEAEIVAVAQQIGPIGRLANMSADQVVGLATAFSSVKIPPELARSVMTKTFGDITRAVETSSPKLEAFGKVAGVSGGQFAAAWKQDATSTFVSLLEGINKSENAYTTLDKMGLASQRNSPAILKLAQNIKLIRSSLDDSAQGYVEGTELNRQYGIMAETTSAKLAILANNFMALLDAVGSADLGPLKTVLDGISQLLGGLSDMVGTDIGGKIAGLMVLVTALAGVLGLAAGGLALFGASSIGLQQGLVGIISVAPRASAAILGSGTASAIAAGEMTGATVAARALIASLKVLGAITIILAIPDITAAANKQVDAWKGWADDIESVKKRVNSKGVFFDQSAIDAALSMAGNSFNKFTLDVSRASANLGIAPAYVLELKKLDDQYAAFVESGNATKAREELRGMGLDSAEVAAILPATSAALRDVAPASAEAGTASEQMAAKLQEVQEAAAATEEEIKTLRQAILDFGASSISVESSQIALSAAFNAMTAAAAEAGATLTGTDAASLGLRNSFLEMDSASRDAAIALIENGASAEEANAKYLEGRDAIIQARIAKGEDMETARAWADRVLGTTGEATAAIQQYSDKLNGVPGTKDTTLSTSGDGDTTAKSFLDTLRKIPSNINVSITGRRTIIGEFATGGLVSNYASGGAVRGPGTGTSDSINARLSNGEYVITAARVRQFGVGYFDALNSGRAPRQFAAGGPVTPAPLASSSSGMTALDPAAMRLLRNISDRIGNVEVSFVDISRAAATGDRSLSGRGGR